MKTDDVNVAFDIILEELDSVIEDLNEEGGRAFSKCLYEEASRLSDIGSGLVGFKNKLEELKDEWTSKIDPSTRKRFKVKIKRKPQSSKKGPRTNITVKFRNGPTIQRSKAKNAFVDTIEKFGIEKVKELKFQMRRVPLVGDVKSDQYSQTKVGRYYVITHSTTQEKKQTLEKIANNLRVPITVDIY